ncbi:hypothetical protein, partial [Pseudomonas amygdali]|uniref:hypothetical protein n=1 Tax=Pseudomonas amygdali TaxID=47877 RepID=UPI001FB7411C
ALTETSILPHLNGGAFCNAKFGIGHRGTLPEVEVLHSVFAAAQDIFLSSLACQRNKIAFSLSGPMPCESLHALVLLRYGCIRAQ